MAIDFVGGPATTDLGRQLHLSTVLAKCRENPDNLHVEVTRPDFARSFPQATTTELAAAIRRILALDAEIAELAAAPLDFNLNTHGGMTPSGSLVGLEKARQAAVDELVHDNGTGRI